MTGPQFSFAAVLDTAKYECGKKRRLFDDTSFCSIESLNVLLGEQRKKKEKQIVIGVEDEEEVEK